MSASAAVAAGNGNGAAPAIDMCDQEGCTDAAVFSYVWDWGVQGKCCQKHHFLLNQAAGNISRGIQFSSLAALAPAPLLRDERTRLIAEKLSAEAELVEVKARGVDLYHQNTQLTAQVQSLTVRNREADAQLRDQKIGLADMAAQLERREAELGNAVDELGRVRTLVPRPGAADAASDEVDELRKGLVRVQAELERRCDQIRLHGDELAKRDAEIATLKRDAERLAAELEERNTVGGGEASTSSTPTTTKGKAR